MSGLRKQKEYDWKDSNVENIGSEEDRRFKKNAAEKEPAWNGVEDMLKKPNKEAIKIWRIEKFEVKDWPKEKYGHFFNGDSYIILHAERAPESDEILYDVHFWIGEKSTQDEYGTAAYKTVELDTYLDDRAVQHREVKGEESEEFKEYFKELTIDEGGIESGFNKVVITDTITVVHFKMGEPYVTVPYAKKHLRCDDGYLVIFEKRNNGSRILQEWGDFSSLGLLQCNIDVPANRVYTVRSGWLQNRTSVAELRFGKSTKSKIFSPDHLMGLLKGKDVPLMLNGKFNTWMGTVKKDEVQGLEGFGAADTVYFDCQEELEKDAIFKNAKGEFIKRLQRLVMPENDKKKKPFFEEIATNDDINESLLNKDDVFLLETEDGVVVWIGKDASTAEKTKGFQYAEEYLRERGQNPMCGISCMRQECGKCPRVWTKHVKKQDKATRQQGRAKGRHNKRM